MRKYFVIAYVIIGLLVFFLIASTFDFKWMGNFNIFKSSSLRKGTAPSIASEYGWVNTDEPIRMKELRGKVVLLDFWTYCCINCMHTLRDIKRLEAKYPNELVVIGIHSGKFTNESLIENVRQAVIKNGIKHPVVNDASFAIWHRYSIKAWPTFVLIDPDGIGAGYFSGEGNYEAMDEKISLVISEFRANGRLNEEPVSFVLEVDNTTIESLSFPGSVYADEESNRLFIADTNHNRIVITDLEGEVIDIIGDGTSGRVDGEFSVANFRKPNGMCYSNDTLYVTDTENHLVRKLDFKERIVSTIAGTGKQAVYMAEKGGNGLDISLNSPWDVVLVKGKLYITMAGSHQIWVMDLASNQIHPFAGNGRQNRIDGPRLESSLAQPGGITTDGTKLFFVDSETSSVRISDLNNNGEISSIIGSHKFMFGDKDGIAGEALLQHPLGIAHHNGVLYVADTYNHKIKIVRTRDKSCGTYLGTGKAGKEDGKLSQFYEPAGLSFAKGRLYIADTNNHTIRVVNIDSGDVSTLKINGL